MTGFVRCLYSSFFISSALFINSTNANGLDDLAYALSQLQNTPNLSGTLSFEIEETRGKPKDDDYTHTIGSITADVEYTESGLDIRYPFEVMQKVEIESRVAAQNDEADTPTLKAVNALRIREVNASLAQASLLEQTISDATLVSESSIEYQGKPARELLLELPITSIVREKRIREYVDKFDNEFRIIIDDQGFPLASTLTYSGKGRAYIVLFVEASGERNETYQVINGRLVSVDYSQQSRFDSTFGEGTRKTRRTFTARN